MFWKDYARQRKNMF